LFQLYQLLAEEKTEVVVVFSTLHKRQMMETEMKKNLRLNREKPPELLTQFPRLKATSIAKEESHDSVKLFRAIESGVEKKRSLFREPKKLIIINHGHLDKLCFT
jgi:hypothetical protein